jgi:hypothetical protein
MVEPLSIAVGSALDVEVDGVRLNDDVALRTYVDPDYGSIILNGRFQAANGDVYGELVRFDPETNIPLLMQNSSSKAELEVRELVKPNDAEVLRGMTFFLIREDHVLVIEQDLGNTAMERSLRWLLCERTTSIRSNARIALIPKLFLGDELDAVPDIRMIRLKPGAARLDELDLSRKTTVERPIDVEPATDILGILRAAHFDTTIIERIMRDNSLSVEMTLSVVLKAGRSTMKVEGADAMSLLRNVPEDDLILLGEGIRKNRGVYERLSNPVMVELKGNILDRKDAWRALREAVQTYRDNGLI